MKANQSLDNELAINIGEKVEMKAHIIIYILFIPNLLILCFVMFIYMRSCIVQRFRLLVTGLLVITKSNMQYVGGVMSNT